MNYYNQCTLEKEVVAQTQQTDPSRLTLKQVSWIPTKYASLGRIVKLKNDQGEWEDGWTITSVGEKTPENVIPDIHAGIKAHRKSTGDSLKKA